MANTLREEVTKDGYNREEEYFYRQNQELIEQRRKQLDEQRAAQRLKEQAAAHWMRCPKCGTKMESMDFMQVMIEQCPSCHGVYLDRGELETLLHAREPTSFLEHLKRAFKPREDTPKLF